MSRNTGLAWQAILDAAHRDYSERAVASVWRQSPPVRVRSPIRDGMFRASWAGDGPPDYIGVLLGGRGVVFDAKDTVAERWPFADLVRHQARDLQAAHNRGAAAFLAVRTAHAAWVLPWAAFGPQWWAWFGADGRAAAGTASLSSDDLDRLGRRMPRPGDWLPVLA